MLEISGTVTQYHPHEGEGATDLGDKTAIKPGRVLTGAPFNEPIRAKTVRPNGVNSLMAGLFGTDN